MIRIDDGTDRQIESMYNLNHNSTNNTVADHHNILKIRTVKKAIM